MNLRIFVALEIPEKVREEIGGVLGRLQILPFSIKWVERENVHLTLSFVGYLEEAQLSRLLESVKKALRDIPPFVLKPNGLLCLPNFQRPRIIALKVEGEVETLERLYRQLHHSLLKAGFRPRTKGAFLPHLTLGRVRPQMKGAEKRALGKKLLSLSFKFTQKMKVDSVTVFKSDLFPQGPVYTRLQKFPLSTPTSLVQSSKKKKQCQPDSNSY